jgi:hypothetical protein
VFERTEYLYGPGVERHLAEIPDPIVRRYARRLGSRPPSIGAQIAEPMRSIEVACFLRYCLLSTADQLILMFRRRVADLARTAGEGIEAQDPWKKLFCNLLDEIAGAARTRILPDGQLRECVREIEQRYRGQRPPSRSARVRARLLESARMSRPLLQLMIRLPWQSQGAHPVALAIDWLRTLYARNARHLPETVPDFALGSVWKSTIAGGDRERALRALEIATLSALRRAVRNGSLWIDHSLSYRSREHLFISPTVWQVESKKHYTRLQLPRQAAAFLDPLLERVRKGIDIVDQAAGAGALEIDDDLHLAALKAEEGAPEVEGLRRRLSNRIGDAQLPEILIEVDAQTRFSWIMLGREPRSADELLMVYAGILAHGTALSAAEMAPAPSPSWPALPLVPKAIRCMTPAWKSVACCASCFWRITGRIRTSGARFCACSTAANRSIHSSVPFIPDASPHIKRVAPTSCTPSPRRSICSPTSSWPGIPRRCRRRWIAGPIGDR